MQVAIQATSLPFCVTAQAVDCTSSSCRGRAERKPGVPDWQSVRAFLLLSADNNWVMIFEQALDILYCTTPASFGPHCRLMETGGKDATEYAAGFSCSV